jgi:hypothetical protein
VFEITEELLNVHIIFVFFSEIMSSSSLSSSESDTGIYTNDEGREGKIMCL